MENMGFVCACGYYLWTFLNPRAWAIVYSYHLDIVWNINLCGTDSSSIFHKMKNSNDNVYYRYIFFCEFPINCDALKHFIKSNTFYYLLEYWFLSITFTHHLSFYPDDHLVFVVKVIKNVMFFLPINFWNFHVTWKKRAALSEQVTELSLRVEKSCTR